MKTVQRDESYSKKMNRLIILDSGPLSMISHPKATGITLACKKWFDGQIARNTVCAISAIADYEVRRELMRGKKSDGLKLLDDLRNTIRYIPISVEILDKAAELWAQARNQGTPAAPNLALDADMIVAAQAICLQKEGWDVIIATY
jgi:predicted nucleic acid-binding protein